MLTESARVTRRDGNRVELELQRGSACGHCELSQGCGTGALARLLRRRSRPLVLETDRDCRPGDEVLLVLPESSLVSMSLVIYGTPLLGMVLSGLLASAAAAPEWLVAITAIAGFCAGFVMATYIVSRFRQTDLVPQIEDIHMNSGKQSRS